MDGAKDYAIAQGVTGAIFEFLKTAGFDAGVADVIAELAVALPGYREEGTELHPLVFLLSDVDSFLGPSRDRIALGTGPCSAATILTALKKGAPLAQGGWAIYVALQPTTLAFGVFRQTTLSLTADPSAILRDGDTSKARVAFLRAVANDVVELRRADGTGLHVHLCAGPPRTVDLHTSMTKLVSRALSDVQGKVPAGVDEFLRVALVGGVQRGHGTLVAVTPSGDPDRKFLDGIWLPAPLSIADVVVGAHETSMDRLAVSRRIGLEELLHGMLSSDGILCLGSAGTILGFNLIVDLAEAGKTSGGARSKAFSALEARVGKSILCALRVSEDGEVAYSESEKTT